jgi:hypothetical protein
MNSGDRREHAGKEIAEDGSNLLTGKAMAAFERVKGYRNTRPSKSFENRSA